jgi:phosphohistidine phosphatase
MDLILWRHAQAEDGVPDAGRRLTPRGQRDAARMARWLLERLPTDAVVLSSPARRARETVAALGREPVVLDALAPGAAADDVIAACGWPGRRDDTVLVVGHNPWIGQVIARLVGGGDAAWPIRKGALWWLSRREGERGSEVLVKAVLAPDLLR